MHYPAQIRARFYRAGTLWGAVVERSGNWNDRMSVAGAHQARHVSNCPCEFQPTPPTPGDVARCCLFSTGHGGTVLSKPRGRMSQRSAENAAQTRNLFRHDASSPRACPTSLVARAPVAVKTNLTQSKAGLDRAQQPKFRTLL